jgi:uncharacterized repeat protein (TIGR03803 family)
MKRGFLAAALLIASSAYAGSTFKVLHSFHCDPSGCGPTGGLVFDDAGNLYGTTGGGGDADATVFRLSPSSDGQWTYRLLYTLTISQGSAVEPSLTLDPAGNLYGTSINGGAHDVGSVFELSRDPAVTGGWSLRVLHSFLNTYEDGQYPWDKVILDKAGNVYGTTRYGGPEDAAGGVVFELTPGTGGDWGEDILYDFPSYRGGCCPYAEVIFDEAGDLYGTTPGGGTGNGDGTVFKLTHTASGWKEALVHSFQGPDGSFPITGLVFDAKGNLYGTTQEGGGYNSGTVFQLAPTATGRWKETILYDFPQFRNGGGPVSTPAFDKAGNLYGTAAGGIGPCSGGCGVVYKLAPGSSGKWTYSVLHRFTDKGDGAEPNGAVVFDKTGTHLYGTAIFGGTYNQGVVYEITP